MTTAKTTNFLLAIIALCLIWIAFKPGRVIRTQMASAQSTSETQGDMEDIDMEDGAPQRVICTISAVEPAAVASLMGELQQQVVGTLNQVTNTLLDMNVLLDNIQNSLSRSEIELQAIRNNTSAY